MKLLVDMGNSRIKWATVSEGILSQVSTLTYGDFALNLQTTWQQMDVPAQVLVSCVAKHEHWTILTQLIETLWDLQPERVCSARQEHGVTNSYPDAAKLGSDRWAALVAAHLLYPGTLCIADCGTALTVDGLSAEGIHLGGIIVPGIQMMQAGLTTNTAGIGAIADYPQPGLSESLLGHDTSAGIINGSWLASIATVEKVYSSLCSENAAKVGCIITGGNAEQIAEYLSVASVVDADLVLKGLAIIAGEKIIK